MRSARTDPLADPTEGIQASSYNEARRPCQPTTPIEEVNVLAPKKRKDDATSPESTTDSQQESRKRSRGASSVDGTGEEVATPEEQQQPQGFAAAAPFVVGTSTSALLPQSPSLLPSYAQHAAFSSHLSSLPAELPNAQQHQAAMMNPAAVFGAATNIQHPQQQINQPQQQFVSAAFPQQQYQHPQLQFMSNQRQLHAAVDATTGRHPPSQLASILAIQQQAATFAAVGQLLANNPLIGQIFLQQLLNDGSGVPTPAQVGAGHHPAFSMMGGLGPAYSLGQTLTPAAAQQMVPPFAIQGTLTDVVGNNALGGGFQHHPTLRPQQQAHPSVPVYASLPGSMGPAPPQQEPASSLGRGGAARASAELPASLASLRQILTVEAIGPDVPPALPVVLFLPEDETKLSAYQILLRNQIEAFSAMPDDLATHARGRNKPITVDQVGIRCKHCKHLASNQRNKGSVYFPFSRVGLYQAAQNMGSSHFHGESCAEMPEDLKQQFVEVLACKSTVGSGKQYWAKAAGKLGLMDTEQGIRFVRDLIVVVPP